MTKEIMDQTLAFWQGRRAQAIETGDVSTRMVVAMGGDMCWAAKLGKIVNPGCYLLPNIFDEDDAHKL